jgi:hypothetical protein
MRGKRVNFDNLDYDHHQVAQALASLSQRPSEDELKKIFESTLGDDAAADGVNFGAFCHIMYNTKAFHHASAFTLSMTQRRLAQSKSQQVPSSEPVTSLHYNDGSLFRGQATQYGVFHGKGSYDIGADGASYTGSFSQGRFHGHGHLWYPDCASFEGSFENGVRTGEGTMRFPDGSTYVGHFDMGLFEGYGEYTCGSGDVYKGNFKEGKKEGNGKIFYRDGSVFEGAWHNDHRRPGSGTLEWDTGDVYQGAFAQSGLYHGQGKLTLAHSGDV